MRSASLVCRTVAWQQCGNSLVFGSEFRESDTVSVPRSVNAHGTAIHGNHSAYALNAAKLVVQNSNGPREPGVQVHVAALTALQKPRPLGRLRTRIVKTGMLSAPAADLARGKHAHALLAVQPSTPVFQTVLTTRHMANGAPVVTAVLGVLARNAFFAKEQTARVAHAVRRRVQARFATASIEARRHTFRLFHVCRSSRNNI